MKRLILLAATAALLMPCYGWAQPEAQEAIAMINDWEAQITEGVRTNRNKAVFVHYDTKVTNHDGSVKQAWVKMYRNQSKVHLFTDQVNMYQDQQHIMMALHNQQLILWNDAPEGIMEHFSNEGLGQAKAEFMAACTVSRLEMDRINPSVFELELQAPDKFNDLLFIDSISYRFDTKSKKLLWSKVTYRDGYKLREMEITYKAFSPALPYNFGKSAWQQVLNAQQQPAGRYKGYELVDNR